MEATFDTASALIDALGEIKDAGAGDNLNFLLNGQPVRIVSIDFASDGAPIEFELTDVTW